MKLLYITQLLLVGFFVQYSAKSQDTKLHKMLPPVEVLVKKDEQCKKCIRRYPAFNNTSNANLNATLISTDLFKKSLEKLSQTNSFADSYVFITSLFVLFSDDDINDMLEKSHGDTGYFIQLIRAHLEQLQDCALMLKNQQH